MLVKECENCHQIIDRKKRESSRYLRARFCNKKCELDYKNKQSKNGRCGMCGKKIDGWRKYCSKRCFGLAKRKERIIRYCEFCGKPIEQKGRFPFRYKEIKYCSGYCKGKKRIELFGRKQKCEHCKKYFHPTNRHKRIFCSKECCDNSRRTELECQECKKRFTIKNSRVKMGRRFCSIKCSIKYQNDRGMAKRGATKAGEISKKWRLGKTYEELYGAEVAERIKHNHSKFMSRFLKENENPMQTPEARKKRGDGRRGKHLSEEQKKRQSEIMKEYIRSDKVKRRDTKPERIMKAILEKFHIEFRTSRWIADIENAYIADFYLPEFCCVIETDGVFWHHKKDGGNPIDHARTAQMRAAGYKVLRFWEGEITEAAVAAVLRKEGILPPLLLLPAPLAPQLAPHQGCSDAAPAPLAPQLAPHQGCSDAALAPRAARCEDPSRCAASPLASECSSPRQERSLPSASS